jgi:hypothetical protein
LPIAYSQPNVVLFLVDDLGWADNDLSYSQQFAQQRGDTDALFETPNLQAVSTIRGEGHMDWGVACRVN